MPRIKSPAFHAVAQSLAPSEPPLILLELHHVLLDEPIRIVNDVDDVLSNGQLYTRAGFRFVWPDDQERQTPRASLSVSSGGKGFGAFFERTHGGRGAWIRVLQILRSVPDHIEDELTLDLRNVEVSVAEVTGQLGYDDVLNKAGTPYTYRPETAPGIF